MKRGPVDLEIAAGQCSTVAGPSGAGKTLLLRSLADLDPHEGEVRVDGKLSQQMSGPAWRRRVSLLSAESTWWFETVGEHFNATQAVLGALGFSPTVLEEPVARLSTGERQRLALARLIANGPHVLLLDEPTANLDPESQARVEAVITDYCAERGAAVLWVSHDKAQRQRVGSRYYTMDMQGRLSEGST